MKRPKLRRVSRSLNPQQLAAMRRQRQHIDHELQDMVSRDRMRKEAQDESTLSGELRRAIHTSPSSLPDIAAQAHISQLALDEFLTGERTLRSDVLDRLGAILRLELCPRG